MATPNITSRVGSDHNFSASKTMPTPTAIPPATVTEIKTKWGQYGSKPPGRNALMYVEIAVPLIARHLSKRDRLRRVHNNEATPRL
jgi:hypothetical protein